MADAKRTKQILIRCTEEEYVRIKEMAKDSSITDVILGGLNKNLSKEEEEIYKVVASIEDRELFLSCLAKIAKNRNATPKELGEVLESFVTKAAGDSSKDTILVTQTIKEVAELQGFEGEYQRVVNIWMKKALTMLYAEREGEDMGEAYENFKDTVNEETD